ncbi:MAG TPA: ATP-binding protein, partial [Chloroflexota bacterium]|nr:ATP-binding protein [Chloroflexota bacterium]
MPSTTEIAVYRMVQEALVNIAKHAGATRVDVTLQVQDGALEVVVRDNGRGMELPTSAPPATSRVNGAAQSAAGTRLDELSGGLSAGLGLFGAQERISLVGGRFFLESYPNAGTTVRAVIPLSETSTSVRRDRS